MTTRKALLAMVLAIALATIGISVAFACIINLDVLKLTDGAVDPNANWKFVLYGSGGYGSTPIDTAYTGGDLDGVLGPWSLAEANVNYYTLCEEEVPSGYTLEWMKSVNGGAWTPETPSSPAAGVHCVSFGPVFADTSIRFKVNNITPPGDEGCTPGYWKQPQHFDSWSLYSPEQTLEQVFDVPDSYGLDNVSLVGALSLKGGTGSLGGSQILLRAAVAALLNSVKLDYPLATSGVIAQVNAALATGERSTMLELAEALDTYNNYGCTLN